MFPIPISKFLSGLLVASLMLSFIHPMSSSASEAERFDQTETGPETVQIVDSASTGHTEYAAEADLVVNENVAPEENAETPIVGGIDNEGNQAAQQESGHEQVKEDNAVLDDNNNEQDIDSIPCTSASAGNDDKEVALVANPTANTTLDQSEPVNNESETVASETQEVPIAPKSEVSEASITEPALEVQEVLNAAELTEVASGETNQPTSDCDDSKAESALLVEDEKTTKETDIEIINSSDVDVVTEVNADGDSGKIQLTAGNDLEDTTARSGKVNIYANVLTMTNTHAVNSEIIRVAQNFDQASGDLALDFGKNYSLAEGAQALVADMCGSGETDCESLSSFKLTNNSSADVATDVSLRGSSGGNQFLSPQDIEHSHLYTGDVNAVVNVLNIVNTDLYKSRLVLFIFNILGDWPEGDIVFPDELSLSGFLSLGAQAAGEDLSLVENALIKLSVNDDAVIENNVSTVASTGENLILAPGKPQGGGGDVDNTHVTTGTAVTDTSVKDVANTIVINGKMFLGLVNTLGGWSGKVYSLPEHVVMSQGPLGLTFFAASGMSSEELTAAVAAQETPLAEEASGDVVNATTCETDCSNNGEDTVIVDIENNHQAVIKNDVEVVADTGHNAFLGGEVEDSSMHTGNAKAKANLWNFVNTTLISSDLFIGLFNIFGTFGGNILFGRPDVAVTQELAGGPIVTTPGSKASYRIPFQNLSGARADSAQIDFKYNPSQLTFVGAGNDYQYSNDGQGGLVFQLGSIPPLSGGNLQIEFTAAEGLLEGGSVTTFSRISTTAPEMALGNNENLFTTTITQPVVSGGGDTVASSTTTPPGNFASTSPTVIPNPNPNNAIQGTVGSSFPLFITKTNTAIGALAVGQSLDFNITVKNQGAEPIKALVVYDKLLGPGSISLGEQNIEIGDIKSGETVEINYSLTIPNDATNGVYVNSAFAKGILSFQMSTVHSSAATSSFTVGLVQPQLKEEEKKEDLDEKKVEEEKIVVKEQKQDENKEIVPLVLGVNNKDGGIVGGQGAAASYKYSKNSVPVGFVAEAANTLDILGSQADSAYATPIWSPNNITINQPITGNVTPQDNQRQLLSTVLICFLIAIGYALSNLKQRQAVMVSSSNKSSWIKQLGSKLGIF